MRFFLLARDRSSGRVRLMSDRAFDTPSAAVDAAASSAVALELGDDEVLAIDLDSADPVLVLRVPAASAKCAPSMEEPAARPTLTVPGPLSDQSAPDTDARAAGELRAALAAFIKPVVPTKRQRPRFPLFGVRDEAVPEDKAPVGPAVDFDTRPKMDLVIELHDDADRSDEDWDARTHDDYTLPHDGALSAAAEEGRSRIDAGERFEPEAGVTDDDRADEDTTRSDIAETDFDGSDTYDADPVCEPMSAADRVDHGWWDALDEGSKSDDSADDTGSLIGDDALFEEVEAILLDQPFEDLAADEFSEPLPTADLPEEPTSTFWEPPVTYYHPANTDFAIWVCADCVYQRTCRKAGTTTPAACGNFQWRSR